jgi:hypothetical protein
MLQTLFQPILFFPRLDFQYIRYLQKKILLPREMTALVFFIDRMDHYNNISCTSDTTIVKMLCEELEITDQHNCRNIIRNLEKLGLVERKTKNVFKINPYICNRLQYVFPSMFGDFTDIRKASAYVKWKKLDDKDNKNFPSLKRRLHNAVFRDIKKAANTDEHTITYLKDENMELRKRIEELEKRMAGQEKRLLSVEKANSYLLGKARPEDARKAKGLLRVVK